MNPWLIIGFIVALAGTWYAGDRYGHSQENKSWVISSQKTQLDYDKKLKALQDQKEAAEHSYSDLKDKTEADRATDKTAIDDGKRRIDELVANGLRRARSCNVGTGQPMPGNSQPVGGNESGAAAEFYLLPEQAPGRLRDRYAEADNYLSLYRACRTRLEDAITKSRAVR